MNGSMDEVSHSRNHEQSEPEDFLPLSNKARQQSYRRFRRCVFGTTLLNLGFFAVLVWLTFAARSTINDTFDRVVDLKSTAQQIRYYGEVLTMSSQMAAATGNLYWVGRYNQSIIPMTNAVAAISSLEPDIGASFHGYTYGASISLITIEGAANRAVDSGNLAYAQSLLNSSEYNGNKTTLDDGITQLIDDIDAKIVDIHSTQSRNFIIVIVITCGVLAYSIPQAIATWWIERQQTRKLTYLATKVDTDVGREFKAVMEDMRAAFYERVKIQELNLKHSIKRHEYYPQADSLYTSLRDTLMVQGLKLRRLNDNLLEAKMEDPADAVQGLIATLNEQQTRLLSTSNETPEFLMSKWEVFRDHFKQKELTRLSTLIAQILAHTHVRNLVYFMRMVLFDDTPRRSLRRLLLRYGDPFATAVTDAFQHFLVQAHSEENLQFWHAVRLYKACAPHERLARARDIYARYISERTSDGTTINLDSITKHGLAIVLGLESDTKGARPQFSRTQSVANLEATHKLLPESVIDGTVFDKAISDIIHLLSSQNFPRFLLSPFCRDLRSELEVIECNISTILAPLHAFHQEKDEAVTTFTMRAVRAGRFQLAQQFWREGLEALSNPNPSLSPAILATIPGNGGNNNNNSNGAYGGNAPGYHNNSPPSNVSTIALISPTAASPLVTTTGSAAPTARLQRNNTPPRSIGFTSDTLLLPPSSSPTSITSGSSLTTAIHSSGTSTFSSTSTHSSTSTTISSSSSGASSSTVTTSTISSTSGTSTSTTIAPTSSLLAPLNVGVGVGRRMSIRDVRAARAEALESTPENGTLTAPSSSTTTLTSSATTLSPVVRASRRHTFSPDGNNKQPLPTIPATTTLAAAQAAAIANGTATTDSPVDSPNRVGTAPSTNSGGPPTGAIGGGAINGGINRPVSVSGSGTSSPSPPGTGTSTPTRSGQDPPLDRIPSTIGLPAAASNLHMPLTHSFSFSSTISATSSGTFSAMAGSSMVGGGQTIMVPSTLSTGGSIFGIDATVGSGAVATSAYPPKANAGKRGSLNLKLKPMNPARGSLRQMPAISGGGAGAFFAQAQAAAAAAKARDAAAVAAAQQAATAAAHGNGNIKDDNTPPLSGLDTDRSIGGAHSVSGGGTVLIGNDGQQVRLGTPTSIVGSSIPEEGAHATATPHLAPVSTDIVQPAYFSPSNQPGEPATPTSTNRHPGSTGVLTRPMRASGGGPLQPLTISSGLPQGTSPTAPSGSPLAGPPSPLVFYPSDSSVEAGFRRMVSTPPPGAKGNNGNNNTNDNATVTVQQAFNRAPSAFLFASAATATPSSPLPLPLPPTASSPPPHTRSNVRTPPASITVAASTSTTAPASTSSPVIPILAGTVGSSSTAHLLSHASPRGQAAAASMKEHAHSLSPASVAPAPPATAPARATVAFVHTSIPAAPLPPLPNLRVLLATPSEGNLNVPHAPGGARDLNTPATINESPVASARINLRTADTDMARPGTAMTTTTSGNATGGHRASALLASTGGLRTPVFRIASGGTSVYLRHGEVAFLQLCQGESLAVRGLEQHDLNAADQRLAALVLKMESEKKKWVRALLEEVFGELPSDGRRRTGNGGNGHGGHGHHGGRRSHGGGPSLLPLPLPSPTSTSTNTANGVPSVAAQLVNAVASGTATTTTSNDRKDFLVVQLHPRSNNNGNNSNGVTIPLSPNGNSSNTLALPNATNGISTTALVTTSSDPSHHNHSHSHGDMTRHDSSSLHTPPLTVVPLFRLEAIRCLEDLLRGCVAQQREIELALQATQPWIVPHQLGSPSHGNDQSPNGSPPAGRSVAFAPDRDRSRR